MSSHDERRLSGGAPSRLDATPRVSGPSDDRRELADLAFKYAEVLETLRALVLEFDSLEGVELSRQALALEAELGVTEELVVDSRRYLRDLAKSALK